MNTRSNAVSRMGNIRFSTLILALMLGFLMPAAAEAAIPATMNYQGHLTDSAGNAVNGVVDITFTLYTTPTGASNVWTETHTGVNISGGLFSAELGGTWPLSSLPFDIPYYLGIKIGSDPEMTPRQPLSTSPYAFKAMDADTVGGASAASLDQSAHVTDNGNPHNVSAAQAGAIDHVALNAHTVNSAAHHAKTTSFIDLTDAAADAQIPAVIARDTEVMPTVLAGDGTGSTLDADLLDGLNSSAFSSSAHNHDPAYVNTTGDTMTGALALPVNGLVAGTNQLALSGGFVGIGTASPANRLHVSGGSIRIDKGKRFYLADGDPYSWIGRSFSGGPPLIQIGGSGPAGAEFHVRDNWSGTTRMMVNLNSGNVGIGTTNPSSILHVVKEGSTFNANFEAYNDLTLGASLGLRKARGTVAAPANVQSGDSMGQVYGQGRSGTSFWATGALRFEVDGTFTGGQRPPSRITFTTNPANVTAVERMRITKDGDIGIGTTAPADRLHVVNSTSNRITVEAQGTGWAGFRSKNSLAEYFTGINAGSSSWEIFDNTFGGGVRMTVTSAGDIGIGTSAPTHKLSVNGSASKPGGGLWSAFSDERLKTIDGTYSAGLAEVMLLQPVSYHYRKDNPLNLPDQDEYIGFSAQAVQKVLPGAVSESESGYLLVDGDPILWAMLNAIKEQQAQIESLRQGATRLTRHKTGEIASLREENAALHQEVGKLREASASQMAELENRLEALTRVVAQSQMARQ